LLQLVSIAGGGMYAQLREGESKGFRAGPQSVKHIQPLRDSCCVFEMQKMLHASNMERMLGGLGQIAAACCLVRGG
jgi:hypothetical protein